MDKRYVFDKNGNKMKLKGTPIHNSYQGARQRCNYKGNKRYADYGGRGIRFRWNGFAEFYNDMSDSWFEGATLERINTNGDYCKDNCRWATKTEQARNTRKNIHTEEDIRKIRSLYESGAMTQVHLAKKFGDSQGNISNIILNKVWKMEGEAKQ
jgi:hypothetical protein